MMRNKDVLKQRTNLLKQNWFIIINTILIIVLGYTFQKFHSYLGLLLLTTYYALTNKLYLEIKNKAKPELWSWTKAIIKNAFWITIIYYAIVFLGTLGIIGFILIILLFALWRVFGTKHSRELYFETVDWGADELRRMTGKKKKRVKKSGESNKI